ncbi:MAG: hypothetical protein R2795_08375 [Saprospiraceae bacterium]
MQPVLARHCFTYLDAPVRTIGAENTALPLNSTLEATILPNTATVGKAIADYSRIEVGMLPFCQYCGSLTIFV